MTLFRSELQIFRISISTNTSVCVISDTMEGEFVDATAPDAALFDADVYNF
jgi:hypothetical protein